MNREYKINKENKETSISFDQCFKEMYPAICVFAEKYINDEEISRDLAQNVFIKLWGKFDEFKTEIGIKAFLYKVIRNDCFNYLEHLKVQDKYRQEALKSLHSESSFLSHVLEEETHRMIYTTINKLPAKAKNVINLSIQGLRNKEIAENLNVSVNTVKTHKMTAYRLLKEQLKNIRTILMLLMG